MSLKQWRENGWLVPHETSVRQIADLLKIVDRDLALASRTDDVDWCFGIAYNAALKLCTILLYASGYRAGRDLNHYRTLMSLALILGDDRQADTAYLDRCRMKRNELEYERVGAVTQTEAKELLDFVAELKLGVARWLGEHRPDLLGGAQR